MAFIKGLVPSNPFYYKDGEVNTLRLNYTNSDATMIEEGIKRLGKIIKTYLDEKK
jgi:2-aminoadipate transaminase